MMLPQSVLQVEFKGDLKAYVEMLERAGVEYKLDTFDGNIDVTIEGDSADSVYSFDMETHELVDTQISATFYSE